MFKLLTCLMPLILCLSALAGDRPAVNSIGRFLDSSGRIDMEAVKKSGYQGSIDMAGYQMQTQSRSEGPIFERTAALTQDRHPDDINWQDGFDMADIAGNISAFAIFDNKIVLAGHITQAGPLPVDDIATWDGTSWGTFGNGFNGSVNALIVFQGDLYAGGYFTEADGNLTNRIAIWNNGQWESVGDGFNGIVWALTEYDNKLYAGGEFDSSGTTEVNYIASWDGINWSSVGTGMDGGVYAFGEYAGDLIVGGGFENAGGVSANRIAAWDGATWSALGSGADANVWDFAVYDGDLIAGGSFENIGGVTITGLAAWNGSSWSALEPHGFHGISPGVYELYVDGTNLIAAGEFDSAGTTGAINIASWNGSNWSALAGGAGGGFFNGVRAVIDYGGLLYIGGYFTFMDGGNQYGHIGYWDGGSWNGVGNKGIGDLTASGVEYLTVYKNELIVQGSFNRAGTISVGDRAVWDGTNWSQQHTEIGFPPVEDIKCTEYFNDKLIIAGDMSGHIVYWDGDSWESIGGGVNGTIWDMVVYEDKLVIGGTFTQAGGIPASNIAIWDGVSWDSLGWGLNNTVFSVEVYDNELFAGGAFTWSGDPDSTVDYIGVWRDPLWRRVLEHPAINLGLFTNLINYDGKLISTTDNLNGNPTNYIVAWNGSSWEDLGLGLDDHVRRMLIYNGRLIVTGDFLNAGGAEATHMAAWDGSAWEPLGSGTGYKPLDIAVFNGQLVVGGLFDSAGGKYSSRIAFWEEPVDNFVEVSSLNDDGPGSLRSAITSANTYANQDTITFTVSGPIFLDTPLPEITDDSVIILGSSAPKGIGDIVLDGSGLVSGNGLTIAAADCRIEGLKIVNFPDNGIAVSSDPSATGNTLTQNIIYNNGGLAIDIDDDGLTAVDLIDSTKMDIDESYDLWGTAGGNSTIEFFVAHPAGDAARPADPSGYGEAYEYIGSTTCDPTGQFSYVIPNTVPYYTVITATETDTLGTTSELCSNQELLPRPLIITGSSSSAAKSDCPSFISLQVIDPEGNSIGYDSTGTVYNEIADADYDTTVACDDSVTIQYPLVGTYQVLVSAEGDPPEGATYTIGVQINGSLQVNIAETMDVPESGTDSYNYDVEEELYYRGDANGDATINILDITFLIGFLYQEGPAPEPYEAGDANCDQTINILDITYLIAFLYQDGPEPGCL